MGALNGDSHIRGNLKGNDRGQGREEPAGPPGQKVNKGDTGAQGPKGDTGVQEQKVILVGNLVLTTGLKT